MAVLEHLLVETVTVGADAIRGAAEAVAYDNFLTYGALAIGAWEARRHLGDDE